MSARTLRSNIERLVELRFEQEVERLRDEQEMYWNYGPKNAEGFLEVLHLPTQPLLGLLTERDCALLRTAVRGLDLRPCAPTVPLRFPMEWWFYPRVSSMEWWVSPWPFSPRNPLFTRTITVPLVTPKLQRTIAKLTRPPQGTPKQRLAERDERLALAHETLIDAEKELELTEAREQRTAAQRRGVQLRREWPRPPAPYHVLSRPAKHKRPHR